MCSISSHLYNTYARTKLSFVHGQGAWLYTPDNEAYLDFAGGIAVNSLGHSHPHIVETLKAQAEKLWHVSNLYHIESQESLADRLCKHTFADKVFFTNSGAEAIECAIKTARRYHYSQGAQDRVDIITFTGAFHGRTLATLAAGGQAKYLEGFGPRAPGFEQVAFGDMDALKAVITPQTAAILIEPIQGEGGLRPASSQFLRALRTLCDEHDLLLIFDEVQCGVGRTGKLFAHEWAGVTPDIMAIAKGIGAGFPLGACLATEKAAYGMTIGSHGSTYGGNPLAMAVGHAVLDVVLAPGFLQEVHEKGLRLKQKLAQLADTHQAQIKDIRGEGLMLGIEFHEAVYPNEVSFIIGAARKQCLLTVGAGNNVVRLLPPLVVTHEDIDQAVEWLDAALYDSQTRQGG